MNKTVSPLTLTSLQDIPLIRQGDNLADILFASLRASGLSLQNGDILVLAQKIVSKAEGRMVDLATVTPSPRAFEIATQAEKDPRVVELMLRESREVLRVRVGAVIVEHNLGFVCANAGIDHSNVSPLGEGPVERADEYVLLLPEDPDHTAAEIRAQIKAKAGVEVGVLIIDSHGRAWRNGTVGVTIGLAGMPGLVDLRGQPDLFGYTLRVTQVGAADELAAAASLMMGQAAEGTPAVHVRGFPYPLREGALKELIRPKEQDMFR
ncbi:MAG: coenzyme F420-0:L-glutamate ligase [Chloroflexi bacterium]|nr:coenzyme F420-0:L-glutamate ligase [Chloroflexota bacterium]